MKDDLARIERFVQLAFVEDAAFDEVDRTGDGIEPHTVTGREVIKDRDTIPPAEQARHKVVPDEPSASGDDCLHKCLSNGVVE